MSYTDEYHELEALLAPWRAWARTLPCWTKVWVDADTFDRLDGLMWVFNAMRGTASAVWPTPYALSLYTIKICRGRKHGS